MKLSSNDLAVCRFGCWPDDVLIVNPPEVWWRCCGERDVMSEDDFFWLELKAVRLKLSGLFDDKMSRNGPLTFVGWFNDDEPKNSLNNEPNKLKSQIRISWIWKNK